MSDTHSTPGLATPPDRVRDRSLAEAPDRIAEVLLLARILTDYGRYLAKGLDYLGVWHGFATVAQFFGTAKKAVINAHITRGIMRAMALERVLLERALRRRDLVILAPLVRASRAARPAAAAEVEPGAGAPQADAPSVAEPAARRVHREPEELTTDDLPDMRQLYNEVRRRPIGRTIVAICRDLGISPSLCSGPMWNGLFTAILRYRGSLEQVVKEMRRREKRFDKDHWKHPHVPLPEQTREGVRRVLGFFIGDPLPADAFPALVFAGAVEAVATGPP